MSVITICNGIYGDGSSCRYKSKIIDTNGKHFCRKHVRQGSFLEIDCSICMDALCEQALTLTKCKHIFHTKCLKKWTIDFNTNCPLCRAQICKADVTTQILLNLHVSSQIRSELQMEVNMRMMEISDIRRTLLTEIDDIRTQIE